VTELTIVRTLDAAPERVWSAFTTAEALASWMWPDAWETSADVDLRIGGRYRIASDVHGMAVVGEFVEVDEPGRLVQTWAWEGDFHESRVTVTIEALPEGGTRLTVVHDLLDGDENRDLHAQGWNDCLDRLPDYLLS
jgi:uncharacterized protein YndB with AHSA1/START domain